MTDVGFPVEGDVDLVVGGWAWTRWLRFENFVCPNERIWTLGGRTPGTPPRPANGLISMNVHSYKTRVLWQESFSRVKFRYSIIHIFLKFFLPEETYLESQQPQQSNLLQNLTIAMIANSNITKTTITIIATSIEGARSRSKSLSANCHQGSRSSGHTGMYGVIPRPYKVCRFIWNENNISICIKIRY